MIAMRLRIGLLLVCGLLLAADGLALTKEERQTMRHEMRIGWGDMMYETAMWHETHSTNHYRYTGHIFGEYQYHFFHWLSLGMQVDYEQVWWDVLRDGTRPLPEPSRDHCFYNISVLPTLRFTYFHRPHVNLYTALYGGMTINGGTETDMYGRKTAVAPAMGLTLLGLRAGKDHWFVSLELGGLNALTDKNFIYMVGSRLLTISVGGAW